VAIILCTEDSREEITNLALQILQEDIESILTSLKLIDNGLLTHSAMILFGKNIQRFLPLRK
jgi:predicted HTH transcriptional regulator